MQRLLSYGTRTPLRVATTDLRAGSAPVPGGTMRLDSSRPVVVVALFLIGIYNGLVAPANRFKNAFAQIDVQLKRRYDLIPNLVETAKGYIEHERETLEAVIAARNARSRGAEAAAASPGDPAAMQELHAGRGRAHRRARPAVRGGRGLSRTSRPTRT